MEEAKKTKHPRETAGIISKIMFWWVTPVFMKGFSKGISSDDLFNPLKEDRSNRLGDDLETYWNMELEKREDLEHYHPSLMKALWKQFGRQFIMYGVCTFLEEVVVRIGQPLCMGFLVRYFSGDSGLSHFQACLFAAGVVGGPALYTLTHHIYFFGVQRLGMKMRIACCTLIYRKALRLNRAALGGTSVGQLVNLLSNDVNRFDQVPLFIHYLWVGPIQALLVGVIMYILYLGPSSLAGMVLLVLYVPFQAYMSKLFSKFRHRTAIQTDERIRIMSEVVTGMKVIKMHGWEEAFSSLVQEARRKEVSIIRKTSILRATNLTLFFTSSKIILLITLLVYVSFGNIVTAEKVFASLALITSVRLTVTLFIPFAISFTSEARVSLARLEKFLLREEVGDCSHYVEVLPVPCPSSGSVWISDLTAHWRQQDPPVLEDISCHVTAGRLLAVIGPVGAGKSSLLHTILGELSASKGSIKIEGRVGYVSQEPWIFSGTIRDNITFGIPFDKARYNEVIRVCDLEKDFKQSATCDDLFPVGERGASLSGGQKARVSLARALYTNADVYLLDDPLSAVDANVGRILFEKCIMGHLKKKARILVTHQLHFLKQANQIIIINEGRIVARGTFSDLKNSGVDFASLLEERNGEGGAEEVFKSPATSKEEFTWSRKRAFCSEESYVRGSVNWRVYYQYFTAGFGVPGAILLFVLHSVTQCLFTFSDWWLAYWTDLEGKSQLRSHSLNSTFRVNDTSIVEYEVDSQYYLWTFALFVGCLLVITFCMATFFFSLCMKSSYVLHNSMFKGVVRSTMRFFETNPAGRVLNVFSRDLGYIDEILPTTLYDFITISYMIGGILVVVAVVNAWILVPTAVIASVFLVLRMVYLATSRDVKRLEGTTRSPVFSHLSSTIHGLATVRAFGVQNLLLRQFNNYQDTHTSAWFMFLCTSRWLGIHLDTLVFTYVLVIAITFLFLYQGFGPGELGMALSQAMMMTGMFQWGVRQSAEAENYMTSVERALQYKNLEQEAKAESEPDKTPPESWPDEGRITMKKMSLRYSSDDKPVIKELTCSILPQEKIGIVGRTGAGKSSLVTALARLTEPEGTITIDGVNIQEIGLHDLRRKISIIPQEPVLFSATLRKNLDPFSDHTDEEIWKALEKTSLKVTVQEMASGLSSNITEGGSNLSAGQRQLVCLARAILKRNKILIMDEATANVDPKTDAVIQSTIRQHFEDCTVLTIAHRLHTIMDCDRVLVLDNGTLKEFDSPSSLLTNQDGYFYSLVNNTGAATASQLIQIARQAQERKNAKSLQAQEDCKKVSETSGPFSVSKETSEETPEERNVGEVAQSSIPYDDVIVQTDKEETKEEKQPLLNT